MGREARPLREDGRVTRENILQAAGRLIARKGYAATTSKEICQAAGANIAAINYHFGSREGMYLALLRQVHQSLMRLDRLREIEASDMAPREKVEAFLELFLAQVVEGESWEAQVWAREIITPSPLIYEILQDEAVPKLNVFSSIFASYTGLSQEDPRLYSSIFSFMAPFAMVFYARQNGLEYKRVLPVEIPHSTFLENLKRFAFAGLDAFRESLE